jgi:type I restriction enzyme, R subunit
MSKKFTELRFEEWIEKSLLKKGYNYSFTHSNELESKYDKELCLIEEDVIEFIRSAQSKEYEKLQSQFDSLTDSHILKTIDKTILQRGIIDTLRGGIQTRGCSFELVYFKPKSSLNLEHQELYSKNRFVVVRQLHYSKQNRNSLDMVIFLNGIPIITMELKNQLTGQNVGNSEYQYKKDRDPREPLFKFKRCLVHFCVDNDRVSMTTRLSGLKTKFLPYNKDIRNPIVEDDYRTEYLWNEILTPNSLSEIIENFVLVSKESEKEWDNYKGKVVDKHFEVLIFPRYHQLHLIRKLKSSIVKEGVGHNYLVQHTTGSGKSFEIGWLSHLLTSLYQKETDTKRMFDTILVITDRKVLDKQLQQTVSKLEQTEGVVSSVDINSKQLQEFLEKGKDIIITTVQKFPFISETISKLKGHTFGVVIDEVHSSQTGETSKHLKKSLSVSEEDNDGEIDYEEMIRQEIQSRGKQEHISFFGFTGTPKNKTLELFGRKNPEGNFVPFDIYSMKQSIHEGFTLDVLQNYTSYKRYFKVLQTQEEDEELPESRVKKLLVDFVDSHEKTIFDKVTIILNHFVSKTSKKINGKGRGMVVVRSRKHCVLFHEEMVKQMRERHLSYTCLVAFSGSIYHNARENTETSLNTENGLVKTSIPNGLKDPKYRILIASNKFQTGFDEPLLQSMYVDKKLSGVQCVQTLSRLNRTTKGKTDTFVLDFVNDTEGIVNSFQPYYTNTMLTEETDPDKLYSLVYEIEQFNLYTEYQVDEFCKEFYRHSDSDEKLHPIIDVVVDNFKDSLDEEQQGEFKSMIQSYIRLYSYISQISSFTEVDWEKTYVFLRFLNKKLPKGLTERISIIDSVDLDSLRIQMIGESNLSLEDKEGDLQPISGEIGSMVEEERELLSEIIDKINSVYGIELREEDKYYLQNVDKKITENVEMKKVMLGNNSEDVKKEFYKDLFKDKMIDYTGERMEFYKKVMDDKVLPVLVDVMYKNYRKSIGSNG